GLISSQRVLLALIEKGVSRETAYAQVQRNAMEAWNTKEQFQSLLNRDPSIREYLNEQEIAALFDYAYHTKHVADIFERLGLGE
ncbi:MAG: adenylosuccinate lyase, partial [Desulfosporosinus sp.]